MSKLAGAIIAGVTSFAATNIDDIVVLMIFFVQVNSTFRNRHIIVGQYLGFSTIILASLPGFLGGLIVPKAWIGLLGLVPIFIGISRLVNRQSDDKEVQTVSEELNSSTGNTSVFSILTSIFSPQTYKVAAVTFANGGDNIGIYVPLFASSDLVSLGVILGIFLVMVGVWCYIAYQLTLHPLVARFLTRYGHAIVPFVLIGLGVYILVDSGTYRLLPQFRSVSQLLLSKCLAPAPLTPILSHE
jgi:cadmium resistance transport/sequestration family protein